MVNATDISEYVSENYSELGINKREEITRLLFEISKREQTDFKNVLADLTAGNRSFKDLKAQLLTRRYPQATKDKTLKTQLLPTLQINSDHKVRIDATVNLIPNHFVIEDSVADSQLVNRLKINYPEAKFDYTAKYKNYVKAKETIANYNTRLKTYYIIKEDYDFYKKCACSPLSLYCGYHVVNLGSGCGFECTYCYLQDYLNSPGIILPANIEDFFDQFSKYKQNIRLGSGEITDSLIFDHITEYSPAIVEFFKQYPKSTFEFKTKSDNVDNLLKVTPGDNIVVSWSMNPKVIIESTEFYTASLDERLDAAVKVMNAGYKLAFHFDPMIYFQGWETHYHELVNQIFDRIDEKSVTWVSIGGLRLTPRLKKIIENRFPDNTILDEEFLPSYDGKLRYSLKVRTEMFRKMKEWITLRKKDVYLYLCMEEKEACQSCETAPLKKFTIQQK